MANAVYPLWLKHLLDVWMNLVAANPAGSLRVAAVTTAYTYSTAHEFYSSVSGVLATAVLTGVDTTGGVLDADDGLLTSISVGAINAVVVHWWTGNAATSRLMLYFDDGVNFDLDPSGDVRVRWSNVEGVKLFPLGGLITP